MQFTALGFSYWLSVRKIIKTLQNLGQKGYQEMKFLSIEASALWGLNVVPTEVRYSSQDQDPGSQHKYGNP